MIDKIEHFHSSTLQHGKHNDRIFLMETDPEKTCEIIDYIEFLSKKYKYTKIIAKVPIRFYKEFQKQGYIEEARIPNLYKGEFDGLFLAKYPEWNNKRNQEPNTNQIKKVINIAKSKPKSHQIKLDEGFEFKQLNQNDTDEITSLFKKVFKTYPFNIFCKNFVRNSMNENVKYFGIKKDNELVSISSADMDKKHLNAEMTDFATLPEYRGKNFALYLLKQMEKYLNVEGFKTAYATARSISYAMNITFAKNNYNYCNTLVNNTNIGGNIESLNVWHKNLS